MKEEHYDFILLNGNHDIEEKWFKDGLEHRQRSLREHGIVTLIWDGCRKVTGH